MEPRHLLWVLLKADFWTNRQIRLMAADFADMCVSIYTADSRPVDAITACREYAAGTIGDAALDVARSRAFNAYSTSPSGPARDAAWCAASCVRQGEPQEIARDVAWVCTRAKSCQATAGLTDEDERRTAYLAALDDAWAEQITIVKGYIS
jgi:hypothetical protein